MDGLNKLLLSKSELLGEILDKTEQFSSTYSDIIINFDDESFAVDFALLNSFTEDKILKLNKIQEQINAVRDKSILDFEQKNLIDKNDFVIKKINQLKQKINQTGERSSKKIQLELKQVNKSKNISSVYQTNNSFHDGFFVDKKN